MASPRTAVWPLRTRCAQQNGSECARHAGSPALKQVVLWRLALRLPSTAPRKRPQPCFAASGRPDAGGAIRVPQPGIKDLCALSVHIAAGHCCRWSRLPPVTVYRLVTIAAWSRLPPVTVYRLVTIAACHCLHRNHLPLGSPAFGLVMLWLFACRYGAVRTSAVVLCRELGQMRAAPSESVDVPPCDRHSV